MEETLAWCEENMLRDVGAIFPTAEDFPTKETYRFLRLVHSHPGAALPGELLKANQEEHLDLDKVRIWGGITLICAAYAWWHVSLQPGWGCSFAPPQNCVLKLKT